MDEYYLELKLTLDEVRLLKWLSGLNDVVENPEGSGFQSEVMQTLGDKILISIYKYMGDLV